jgi:phage repressor protein C with HTH and peptisase S24 domain
MHAKLPPTHSGANPIGQRLKMEMKKRGISSVELAKRADVKTSFIYDIISGKSSNPSTVKLARVAETLGINLTYLVGNSQHATPDSRSAKNASKDDYVVIPRIMVDIAAGGGTVISVEHEAEWYYFRKSWIRDRLKASPDDLRMLYVRGDSMEPTLCHNDIVLVDTTSKSPSPPGTFVLFDGYGLVAKRLEYITEGKTIRITSDNPQYSTYERSVDDTFIIGRVVWFAREM